LREVARRNADPAFEVAFELTPADVLLGERAA
jgi:hypothetical protein